MGSWSSYQGGATAGAQEHEELLRWVAELYYLEEQSQAEIAALIGGSVSKVSRLLAEARQCGLVQIHVAPSAAGETALERAVADRFGLEAAYVAPARLPDAAAASRLAAATAARVLPPLLSGSGVIAFSGGYTIARLAAALRQLPGEAVTVVPLQGAWAEGGPHLQNDLVCREAAARLGGRALSLPVPILVDHAATRDALLDDRAIRAVTESWAEVRVAVVGVGAPPGGPAGYPTVMSQLPEGVRAELQRLGVVGDLCAHMFDRAGRFVEHEVSRRTLGIPVAQLRRIPRVVAVAGGVTKVPSLLGALRTGVVRVLVTDQLTAERLLALEEAEPAAGSAGTQGDLLLSAAATGAGSTRQGRRLLAPGRGRV